MSHESPPLFNGSDGASNVGRVADAGTNDPFPINPQMAALTAHLARQEARQEAGH